MKKNILIALTGATALIALTVIAALMARPQAEPTVETEYIEKVRTVYVETTEETTHEETTTVAADTDSTVADTETTAEETEHTYTTEELADYVLNAGINGADREAFLGDRYAEVQAYIDANFVPPHEDVTYELMDYPTGNVLNPYDGINYYGGVLETYYNMDMSAWLEFVYSLGYSGTYWVRSDGVKMFGDYIIVAADYSYEPRGTIVQTSLGTGMVLDTGLGGWAWHDIAVAW